jgi:hypothetical protein
MLQPTNDSALMYSGESVYSWASSARTRLAAALSDRDAA